MVRSVLNNIKAVIPVLCLLLFAPSAGAQDNTTPENKPLAKTHYVSNSSNSISIDLKGVTLEEGLKEIAEKADAGLYFDSDLLPDKTITLIQHDITPGQALRKVLNGTGLEAYASGRNILLRQKRIPKKVNVQEGEVTGVITDATTQEPLPGANVYIEGTSKGASTDVDGKFTIQNISVGTHTLIARFVGYEEVQKQITVSENSTKSVNFSLQPSATLFDEVVVVGYGRTQKKDLTGSVSTVDSEDLDDLSPTVNADQALQGQAAGVYIVNDSGQPGSAAKVRIRGSTSLLGSNQPLYIIDGIPVVSESNIPDDGSTFNRDLLQEGLNSPLGNINPNDIESVSVLKDASAAAIYGSRAANGVIVITTKRGTQDGRAQFDARYSVTTQDVRTTDMLNAEQFRDIYTEAVENAGTSDAFSQSVLDGSYFGDANTRWEEEVSRSNPVTNNFDLSARGGNEQVQYSTSVGVQNQNGVFNNSSYDRYSANLKVDAQLTERLDLQSSINLSSSDQESPDGGLLARIYDFRPDVPVYDENGNFNTSSNYNLENPVALSQAQTSNKTTQLLGSFAGEFDISDHLYLKSKVSLTYNNGDLKSVYPSSTLKGGYSSWSGPGDGFAKEGSSTFMSHLWENTLNYSQILGDVHNITGVLGASWQGDRNEYLQASGEGFPKDEILTNLSSASDNFIISSDASESGLISYLGRVEYDYSNKYLLSLSGRMDRSSKFAEDRQWAFFPAVGGAWRISNESFFSGVNFVDDLKLRASAGVTGQQSFGPYQWRTLYTANQYGGEAAVVKNQLGNSKLQWEVTNQLDVGLDFILFNDRLSGSIGYYEKNTENLMYFFQTPGNTGFNQVRANLGDTENKGVEVELSGDILRSNDFVWNVSANITHNTNKLVKLNDDFLDEDRNVINPPNTGSVLKVGQPLGLMYGYVSDGIIQNQEELDQLNAMAPDNIYQEMGTGPGDLKFRDLNGDGEVTTEDQQIIGNSQPDYTGGFTNTFQYKGLRVSALFTYTVGNDLRWGYQSNGINFRSTYSGENKSVNVLNRWTPENPTGQPRAVYLDPNRNSRISSYYVHDASYLRLSNLSINYRLPQSISPDFFRSASIYMTARNLLTFTNYPGADPETNNLFNDDVSSGLDNSRYPTPRIFTVGLSVGF